LTLAFPKIDQGWLAWISLTPLLLAIRQLDLRGGFIIGFWTGLVHNLGLMYWTVYTMHLYGNLPLFQCIPLLILLAGYLALYTGVFGLAVTGLCDRPWKLMLVAPAAWVALEMVKAHLFTGFPWELLGYSQYKHLWIIQIADLTGVYGVSALIVAVNAFLALAVFYWLETTWKGEPVARRTFIATAGVTALALIAVCGYGIRQIANVDKAVAAADKSNVAVVQGNIDQAHKWDPSFQMITAVKYKELSRKMADRGADLIVWPETATPFYFLQDPLLSSLTLDGIKETGVYYLIGSPSYQKGKSGIRYYNSAYLVTPEGKEAGRYDKVHLVPFGEYVPLKRWLPFIKKMVAQVGDFATGRRGSTLKWRQHSLGVLICYEVIFPELARAMTQNGASLLVNITNDAWFGYTSAAYQHFSMAVFRSVENRRALARAANTGISGFIGPAGRIISSTALFKEAAVMAPVPLLSLKTQYTRWGDWSLGSIVLLVLAAAGIARRLDVRQAEKKR
ncbi:MAG: apolipoprotein N-acyltransferase, partial [Desulfosarcinaceae bacterium]